MTLTFRQISDGFGPPDWFPKEHAPLPDIVAHGQKPHVIACILCHLPNGNGHPESASISGLTVPYIIEQMHAFKNGDRENIRAPAMAEMAYAISEKDLRTAAQYFATIPKRSRNGSGWWKPAVRPPTMSAAAAPASSTRARKPWRWRRT